MRETLVFFLYLLACLVLGALLTYPILQTGWIDQEPHRVMGRLTQLFILLGLWPFLKALGLNERPALGYAAPRQAFLRALIRGWLTGVVILLALTFALIALEVRIPDHLGNDWLPGLLRKALQALIGGLLIGLLEETFFRGALYAAIRRRGGITAALLWTSFLYALLHFMKPGTLPDGAAFDWAGAVTMFAETFTRVFQWRHLDSMIALFSVGVFLGLIRERTGHIGWCIGLHAGWVFVIQTSRYLTDGDDSSAYAWLAGDYDGVIGWLAAAWIGMLTAGFWWRSRTRTPEHSERRADVQRCRQ